VTSTRDCAMSISKLSDWQVTPGREKLFDMGSTSSCGAASRLLSNHRPTLPLDPSNPAAARRSQSTSFEAMKFTAHALAIVAITLLSALIAACSNSDRAAVPSDADGTSTNRLTQPLVAGGARG